MQIGQRVRNGAAGPLYGVNGTVVKLPVRAAGRPERTWIRWDGNFLSNGYLTGHEVLDSLQEA